MHGSWTREWIERRGMRTSTLDVHYLQSSSAFADMRIPVQRPAFRDAQSFADLSDSDLRELARQRAFAGYTSAVVDTVTWHHELDFQPPDGDADIGRVEAVGPGLMREHALDSSYVESWRRVSDGADRQFALLVERGARLERLLIVIGDRFLFVRNRATDLPRAASFDSLIANSQASRSQIIAWLDCEFSTGLVSSGAAPWRIERSTLPWREGQRLTFADSVFVSRRTGALEYNSAAAEHWSVPVNTVGDALRGMFTAR